MKFRLNRALNGRVTFVRQPWEKRVKRAVLRTCVITVCPRSLPFCRQAEDRTARCRMLSLASKVHMTWALQIFPEKKRFLPQCCNNIMLRRRNCAHCGLSSGCRQILHQFVRSPVRRILHPSGCEAQRAWDGRLMNEAVALIISLAIAQVTGL